MRPQSQLLFTGELEHEVGREPCPVATYLFVEPLGRHSELIPQCSATELPPCEDVWSWGCRRFRTEASVRLETIYHAMTLLVSAEIWGDKPVSACVSPLARGGEA